MNQSTIVIEEIFETQRGCGRRYAGRRRFGLYLFGGCFAESCERLPFPLQPCSCCGRPYIQNRNMMRFYHETVLKYDVEPRCHLHDVGSRHENSHHHERCPVCCPSLVIEEGQWSWQFWVGTEYTPKQFIEEAEREGISKRIPRLPKEFEWGQWVYLLHRWAMVDSAELGDDQRELVSPGIFYVFKPSELHIVVETLDSMKLPEEALDIYYKNQEHARFLYVRNDSEQKEMFDGT